jgi:hypothetical protein
MDADFVSGLLLFRRLNSNEPFFDINPCLSLCTNEKAP